MALLLQLNSTLQSNDCTTLRVTDGTGMYSSSNIGGWGSPNTTLSTVNGITAALTLTITITTSNGIETTYDPIDVFTYLGTVPILSTDIVIDITPNLLTSNGLELGLSTDKLPDGWYLFEYNLVSKSTNSKISSYTIQSLVEGTVRNKVYKLLRDVPTNLYINTPNRVNVSNWEELTFPIYILSIFEAMIAYVTAARKNEILNDLAAVENLTYNV